MRRLAAGALVAIVFSGATLVAQNGPDNDPDGAPGYVNSFFQHTDVDSINLYNGQLTVPIPVGPAYPIGPKLKFQAVLVYGSRMDDFGHPYSQDPTFTYKPIAGDPALGIGWTFTAGAIKNCRVGNSTGRCYFAPDGSQHIFGVNQTLDGSQFYLTGSGPYDMWDGDGNHYVFGQHVSGYDDVPTQGNGYVHDFGVGRDGWYLTSVTDPFNTTANSYRVDYQTGTTPLWTYDVPSPPRQNCTFTHMQRLGSGSWIPASITIPATGTPITTITIAPNTDGTIGSFTFPTPSGPAVWTLQYENPETTMNPSCPPGPPPSTYRSILQLKRIVGLQLPSGSGSYQFSYSAAAKGYLTTLTLPTGGTVQYCYTAYSFYHGRVGAVEPGCGGLPPLDDDGIEVTSSCTVNVAEEVSPPQMPICTPGNVARWLDTQLGVVKRTQTDPSAGSGVTDYTQYAFPWGENGDPTHKFDSQTLTVVVLPADVDGRRPARAVLFNAGPKNHGSFVYAGDRTGADIEERIFDSDPNLVSVSMPACGSAPFCASHAVRVTQRTFEYDTPTSEITNRRLKSEAKLYGSGSASWTHTVTYSNSTGETWNGNGRHYNIEAHTGNVGNDLKTITTDWNPSTTPWLPNLFTHRNTYQGSSPTGGRDDDFEFDASTGFLKGTWVWDSNNLRIFFTCRYSDANGNLDQEFSASADYPVQPSATACTDAYSNPPYPNIPAVGANSDAFGKKYTYTDGLLKSAKWINAGALANWFAVDRTRDTKTGWITSSRDSAVFQTTYGYDVLGRVTQITPPGGEAATFVCYPSANKTVAYRATSQATPCPADAASAGNLTWEQYEYDGFGRQVREIRLMPGGAYAKRFSKYDPRGNQYFKSEWVAGSGTGGEGLGTMVATTCAFADGAYATVKPTGAPGTYSQCYDPFSRPQQVVGPKHSSLVVYDRTDNTTPTIPYSDTRLNITTGCVNGTYSGASCTGGSDQVKGIKYDYFGRVRRVAEPDVTGYFWDMNDKLVCVKQSGTGWNDPSCSTNPGGQLRSYTYDMFGRLRSETTPEKGIVTYNTTDAWGSLGNLRRESLPGSLVRRRCYDFSGRLDEIRTNEGGGTPDCDSPTHAGRLYLTRAYNNSASGAARGKLVSQVATNYAISPSPTVTDTYSYSATHGRLSSQTTATTGGSALSTTQSWTYDTNLGLLKTHNHPRSSGTFTETLSYDAGLPTSLSAGGQTVVSSATYQPSGSLASYTTGNGVVTTITADASGLPRPGRIQASVGSFDTGTYKYDGAGNIVQMGTEQFGYDLMSRLTSANLTVGSESYTYDQYGNMLTRGATTFCTTTCTNNKISGTGYGYDVRGNMTGTPGQVMTWDGLDRQIQDQTGGATWKYVYTGDDERVAKAPVSGSWTYTFRDEANRVSTEYVGTTLGRDNLYLGNLLVGTYVSSTLSGTLGWQYYASDHLGTPRLVTDPFGAVVEARKYWPYGGEASAPVTSQRLRFAVMERDPENNHFNDHARHHDFNLGRFTSPDKAGGKTAFPQTWNRYVYAAGNPLGYVDPDGREVKYADDQLKILVKKLVLRYPGIQKTLDRYTGEGRPDLIIKKGDAGKDPLTGEKRAGNTSPTKYEPSYDAQKIMSTADSLPDSGKYLTGATVKESQITIDTGLVAFSKDQANVMVHELGHAENIAKDPVGYLQRTADDETHRPDGRAIEHDQRPEEQEAERYRDLQCGSVRPCNPN